MSEKSEILSDNLEKQDAMMRSLLSPLKEEKASPYLETRVMARLRERHIHKQKLKFWQRVGALSTGFAGVLALLFVLNFSQGTFHQGFAGKATLVQVEVSELKSDGVAYAEVLLPQGVVFYSQKYPNLATQRSLKVQWQDSLAKLPFVIRSESTGKRFVKIKFYDTSGQVVAEKTVGIQFNTAVKENI